MAKWIGGTTAAFAVAFGALFMTGDSLQARAEDPDQWLQSEEALPQRELSAPRTAPAPHPSPVAFVRPAAKPAPAAFMIKRVLPIDGPIRYGEWHWDDAGVPAGPIVITVDLDARVLSVFKGGYEIGTAAVLLGTPQHPTPTGEFPILTKERHNKSEKYGNAPMPWSLRLTWDGVAIHGGHPVENGWASHGCIGIPNPLAAKLFATAHTGDKVIITRGKRAGIGSQLI